MSLVDLIRTAGNLFPTVIQATNALGTVLTGGDVIHQGLASQGLANLQPLVEFGQEGFRSEFGGDNESPNQVRHFIGGLLAGTVWGEAAGLRRMDARENPNTASGRADTNINHVSVPLGADLQRFNGEYGTMRGSVHGQKMNELADKVRDKLCNP